MAGTRCHGCCGKGRAISGHGRCASSRQEALAVWQGRVCTADYITTFICSTTTQRSQCRTFPSRTKQYRTAGVLTAPPRLALILTGGRAGRAGSGTAGAAREGVVREALEPGPPHRGPEALEGLLPAPVAGAVTAQPPVRFPVGPGPGALRSGRGA